MRKENELKDWKLVNFCEFDKYATKSYCAIHEVDESLNLGDITKVDETKLKPFNMICGGSPCFVEGSLVLTQRGYKPIEEIHSGDYVLTHTNSYRKVIKPMINEALDIYKIDTMPSESLYVTGEHPFYIRKRYKEWNNDRRMYDRKFSEPKWVEAKDLDRDCFVGTAINHNSIIPTTKNNLDEYMNNNIFWYLIGRYFGDGWIRNNNCIIICGNEREISQVTTMIDSLKIKKAVYKERTVCKVYIYLDNIGLYCEQFGRGAANKHLTSDILDLPVEKIKSFMEGYIDADGSFTQNHYKITTVSRELVYGIGQCIVKAYNRPFSIYFIQRPKTCEIEGRIVNQRDQYQITYKLDTNTQDKAFYENGYIWSPVNDVNKKEYNGLVYNLEVEEDNSYVVQNIIVHNCQDFSVAGKQKGSVWTCKDCGHEYNPLTVHWSQRNKCPNCSSENIEKTRSSLLVEYLRVIRANKPNFGMYENVKNIVGKQFRDTTFKLFEDELHEYGYNTYWEVLNAKDYGIPQNRERVYLIFIKKDLDNGKFVFPKGFDNGIRLKDVLEGEVDEKYYILDDKVQKFLVNLKSKNICENDTLKLDGNNYNQRCVVHTPNDFCRTIIGSGGNGGYHAGNEPKVLVHQSENVVKQVGNISDCNGNWKNPQVGRIYDPDGCSPTLNTCGGGSHEPKIVQVGNVNPSGKGMNGNVFSEDGLAPTLTTNKGEGNKITVKTPLQNEVIKVGKTVSKNNKSHQKDDIIHQGGISSTLLATDYKQPKQVYIENNNIRIRKLTPKECFRLMGFSDKDFYAAKTGSKETAQEILEKYPHQGKCQMDEVERISRMSNSQLYKQSGNSIVVDVLYYIFVEIYKAMPYLFEDLKLSSFFSGIGAFEVALDRLYEGINTGNFTKPQVE